MKSNWGKWAIRIVALGGLIFAASASAAPGALYWHEDQARTLALDAPHPSRFRALTLDVSGMGAQLKSAHASGIASAVSIPQPEGGFTEFLVVDSGTMPPELAAKYPDILSFKGSDAKGRPIRLDMSPMGFQAMVFDPAGIWVVRPEQPGAGDRYISFNRAALDVPSGMGTCDVHSNAIDPAGLDLMAPAPMTKTGVNRRVYRAAVAANNKYIAAVGGGTVAGGLAATVTAVNRVTQVYEYEMAIQLVLVPNNDLLMYPNSASDPFASNGTGVINNSTSVIDAKIGSASYDIGHVFTTGSGGVAYLGVVCNSSRKGGGTTGMSNPTGDAFYIDYVAHEMGHQFGGNHPFNGAVGNCSGANRNGSTAYEPGSGTTIMSYAGICGADDLQPHSDPFFHAISLQEITNYTNAGGNCSANTPNTNQAPIIDAASLTTGYTIPARTPFLLSATATDADASDTVMYSWEEWDLGPQAPLSAGDNGSSPIFRAYAPVATGVRLFPSLSTILGGPAIKGETLPTTTRTLKFRVSARDLRAGNGTSQSADVSLSVNSSAGPFKVTAPASGASWGAGQNQTVTWDVAGTNAAPINCANVDIDLSVDGGVSWPTSLAANVPNSGSRSVVVPSLSTSQARVRVNCANNVFFNVSPGNFSVSAGAGGYTVGGTVSGLAGSGLALKLNGGANFAIGTNGAFSFPLALADGASYEVTIASQPGNPAQTCVVGNGSGTVQGKNVTNVSVTCAAAPTYHVGGTVTGLHGGTLVLKLDGGTGLPINSNGPFTLLDGVASGVFYNVIVATQPAGQNCSVANGNGIMGSADVSNVAVTCVDLPTYTVGGSVSGLSGSGLALKLNGGTALPVTANGAFTFPDNLVSGSNYSVTLATNPTGQTCTIQNASGQIASSNVANVAVTCTDLPPQAYTVGGRVKGLASAGLVLELNGGNPIAMNANGLFVFTMGLATGTTYEVTVAASPSTPVQTCVVNNGSGTIGTSNVTDVQVTCAAPITDRIFIDGFESAGN